MRSPLIQILDAIVKLDARGARKVRDMADAHLRDLEEVMTTKMVAFVEGAEFQRGLEAAVIIERERLDGPDDDCEEPAGR